MFGMCQYYMLLPLKYCFVSFFPPSIFFSFVNEPLSLHLVQTSILSIDHNQTTHHGCPDVPLLDEDPPRDP